MGLQEAATNPRSRGWWQEMGLLLSQKLEPSNEARAMSGLPGGSWDQEETL